MAVHGVAIGAITEVDSDLGRVFRGEFLIQIFPKMDYDLVTQHPFYPRFLSMLDTASRTVKPATRFLIGPAPVPCPPLPGR